MSLVTLEVSLCSPVMTRLHFDTDGTFPQVSMTKMQKPPVGPVGHGNPSWDPGSGLVKFGAQ